MGNALLLEGKNSLELSHLQNLMCLLYTEEEVATQTAPFGMSYRDSFQELTLCHGPPLSV